MGRQEEDRWTAGAAKTNKPPPQGWTSCEAAFFAALEGVAMAMNSLDALPFHPKPSRETTW